ncbi:MAG: hypothetical protein WDN76_03495 [Alphaproteobacteria bacterium]
MSVYPIAETAEQAAGMQSPTAKTAVEAAEKAGGPVYLAVQEMPGAFATVAEADDAVGGIYGEPRFELVSRDNAYRVMVRFWRPAPAAPVARTAAAAARRPLGFASSPEDARKLLGAPAERVSEPLWRPYATRTRALAQIAKAHLADGLAEIIEREGRFVVQLSFWRPLAPRLSPAERAELQQRVEAPLRAPEPQLPADMGLFEQPAPENPAIVLAEEGDGRMHGE